MSFEDILIRVFVILVVTFWFLFYRRKRSARDRNDESRAWEEQSKQAAEREEQRRREREGAPALMPDQKYDFWQGEKSLINPTYNALDSKLDEICRSFAKSNPESRAKIRSLLLEEELDTLITFSTRSAVFALREKSLDHVVNGLDALAMIEIERIDYRDAMVAMGLLCHSANRIGGNADQLFLDASAIAEPAASNLFSDIAQRSPHDKRLFVWGFDELETRNGIGFIGRRFTQYDPSYDLKQIVVEISDLISADKYQSQFVHVADEFPRIWLDSKNSDEYDAARQKIQAVACISAQLRPGTHPQPESQMFSVFLVEMSDEASAQSLLAISKRKKPEGYCVLGLAEGRLFCLIVARAFVQGTTPFETSESLTRFSNGITAILRNNIKT